MSRVFPSCVTQISSIFHRADLYGVAERAFATLGLRMSNSGIGLETYGSDDDSDSAHWPRERGTAGM